MFLESSVAGLAPIAGNATTVNKPRLQGMLMPHITPNESKPKPVSLYDEDLDKENEDCCEETNINPEDFMDDETFEDYDDEEISYD